jgi:hypothetical protein
MGQPMPMVMLLHQEVVMIQVFKSIKIHHKLMIATKTMMKQDWKMTQHMIKTLTHHPIKTMVMKMMTQSKEELKCLTQEYIIPFNGITPLTTS